MPDPEDVILYERSGLEVVLESWRDGRLVFDFITTDTMLRVTYEIASRELGVVFNKGMAVLANSGSSPAVVSLTKVKASE